MKTCIRCEKTKPLDEFPRNRHKPDGLHYYCRCCLAAYYVKNRERIRERQQALSKTAEYKAQHKKHRSENAERYRGYSNAWRRLNPERSAMSDKIKRIRRKEAYAISARKWRALHPDMRRLYQARRRAGKLALPATLTNVQWEALKAAYKDRCAYCGKKMKLTQDHVVPMSKGGPYSIHNIVPACGPCNSRKYTKPPPVPIALLLL